MPKLSILIPSLTNRAEMLSTLKNTLLDQADALDRNSDFEIIDCVDNGESPTGRKRNNLLDLATGDYVAFVDDDDDVSPQYVRLVFEAMEDMPDVIGIKGVYFIDGNYQGVFEHSIEHRQWSTYAGNRYLRCPNHLNPVRTSLARQVRFPDITMGEDHDYSTRLLPLLKTERMIQKPIYNYLARSR